MKSPLNPIKVHEFWVNSPFRFAAFTVTPRGALFGRHGDAQHREVRLAAGACGTAHFWDIRGMSPWCLVKQGVTIWL